MFQRKILASWKAFSVLIAVIGFLVSTCPTPCLAETESTNIVASPNAPAPVTFGIQELQRVLKLKGVSVSVSGKPSTQGVQVIIQTAAERELQGPDATHAPSGPESYAVSVVSPETIIVEGSDAVGAMYGAMDLAEQVDGASDAAYFRQVHAVTKSPFLVLRGVNMFVTTQDIDNPDGAFWSDEYWHGYLDMMARNRYNLLDIHGPCDAVTLTFPNGFAYFVNLPDFPQVGVGPEKAAKNLARFRQVIRMAADRGIKVAYMNYEASAPIGPWKTRTWGVDERWVARPQEYLESSRLEEYTRQAVLSFLKQVPELWMFGFRVGESGQPEDFYKKTYLAALAELPDSLNVYVRTWIADPEKIRELASSTRHHLYIEPKYNGEQLGLPYQAALGGRHYPPSGSYEDYTNYPKNYSILWQIRAHGTTRVFFWGDPDFARRTVRSCKFGQGVGFSMEPMEAYLPAAEYLHHNPQVHHDIYKWMFEREWLWHLTWGRAAYDPEVPETVWTREFARRFGPQAGPLVYKAVVDSSKIVPFIYSYHSVGLDHQNFAPEFETGDHALDSRHRLWQGSREVPYGGNNDDFLRVTPLDRTAMVDPAHYVDDFLNRVVTGQMKPFDAARYLDAAADGSEQAIEAAGNLHPDSPKEFDCIARDVQALDWLARYYAERIRSVTHLEFYRRTFQHSELTAAYDDLYKAVADWDNLSAATEQHFGYVPELIRMGVNQFRWRDEGRTLGADMDQINNLEFEFQGMADRRRDVLGHLPPFKARPGKPLPLTVTYVSADRKGHVFVFYKNAQETGYKKLPLQPVSSVERTWSVVVPSEEMVPGRFEYYFEENLGVGGSYGGTLENHPPYRVFVTNNDVAPVITHQPPEGAVRGASVALTVGVKSPGKLSSVRVYYKRMPAYDDWVSMEMSPSGQGQFSAAVPLTPEGILYYFEAVDEDGNAANYPNFLLRTPYFNIEGWDAGGAAGGSN
ncbi:MAG: hypothetical protein ABSF45_17140 [Terriglobia bacterium]|jgi:hypothetical protein